MSTLEFLLDKHAIDRRDEPPYLLGHKSRQYLLGLFRELGFTMGAEIGMGKGVFSRTLCNKVPGLKLYAIDPFLSYGYYQECGFTQERMDLWYEEAKKNVTSLNCVILREFSDEAVHRFEDGSLDFVFIDGNHGFEYAYEDIRLWSPKVRKGGIVAGDDYFNSTVPGRCRVKDAVDLWTRQQGIRFWFVLVGSTTPAWFWVRGEES